MKRFIISTAVLVLVSIASITQTFAQPPFEAPLTVMNGAYTDTLYFGILPIANFCIVATDGMNGHFEIEGPPGPLPGVFDARFFWPRAGSGGTCFGQGSWNDFRPFIAATQRDTFRVRALFGQGTTMVFSWPANLSTQFTQLTLRYFDQVAGNNVSVDMLTTTSADVTDAGDPATVTIFSGGLVVTSVKQPSPTQPGEFALHQNYPNPFNPNTRIVYRLGRQEPVSLRVFDLLGREVCTLVDEEQEPGEHSVEWTPKAASSGVYVCRLITSAGTIARKMLFIR